MITTIPAKNISFPLRFETAKYHDAPENIRQKFESIKSHSGIGGGERGLYIWGSVGTGKTHLIYSLIQSPKEELKNLPVMVLNATEMLRKIRSQFDRPAESYYDDLFEQILNFNGLFILDDLGSEKLTEWVMETFYLIINKKYEEKRPIIFTSNLPLNQLADRIGDRIVSRIVEMCDIVELRGEDRRLKK